MVPSRAWLPYEDGTQQEHRQQDTWSLLGLAPFVGEEVTVHNTSISLLTLIGKHVGSFKFEYTVLLQRMRKEPGDPTLSQRGTTVHLRMDIYQDIQSHRQNGEGELSSLGPTNHWTSTQSELRKPMDAFNDMLVFKQSTCV